MVRRKKKLLVSSQANLFGKTLGQIREESMLKQDVENLELELERIDHLRHCERCMVEAMMSIERYYGRMLPWYLDLVNDLSDCYDDCPKPQDYEIGYYGNDMQPGTTKFIKARLVWAEKVIREELRDGQTALKKTLAIRAW